MILIPTILAAQLTLDISQTSVDIISVRENQTDILETQTAQDYTLTTSFTFVEDGNEIEGDPDAIARDTAVLSTCEGGVPARLRSWRIEGNTFTINALCTGMRKPRLWDEGLRIDFTDRDTAPEAPSYSVVANLKYDDGEPAAARLILAKAMGFAKGSSCAEATETPNFERADAKEGVFYLHFNGMRSKG